MMIQTLLKKNIKPIIEEIKVQSETHPDPALREFYQAVLQLNKNNKKFRTLIETICQNREDLNPKHFTNLMYRAVQYILIFENSRKELENYKQSDWEKEIESIINNDNATQLYQELVEHENTQTTIYQRYLGPKAAINAFFSQSPVSVVDIGCGLNLGLPGLELSYPFDNFEDNTVSKELTRILAKGVQIKQGCALDLVNPKEKKKWALACGFYPKELKNLPITDQMCDFLWERTNVKFFKHNLLNISDLWKKEKFEKVDVVIASTVLYQISQEERETAFSQIRQILKKGGILVINDFVSVDGTVSWNTNWFKKEASSYKTVVMVAIESGFASPLEFLLWESGRCKKAGAGRDFSKILELNNISFNKKGGDFTYANP